MTRGAGLLADPVEAGRVADVNQNIGPLRRICLSVLLAQAVVSPHETEQASYEAPEPEIGLCERMGSLCLTEMLAPDMIIIVETEPEIATIVTTTIPPTTTTTTQPSMSCEEIRDDVTLIVPTPEPWELRCTGEIGLCKVDGQEELVHCIAQADPVEKIIKLKNRPELSNGVRRKAVAHDIAHAWQDKLGFWTKDSPTANCLEIAAPPTDEYAPFCNQTLEIQADHFAYAFGYTEGNQHGSEEGAAAICQLFEDHGASICKFIA